MPEPEKRKAMESNDRLDESHIPLVAGFGEDEAPSDRDEFQES